MPNRIAIFTDLDGTLIRHEDYSFAPVKSLLRKLQFKHIPVVLASSKTRAEIEHYRREMKLADPFIVENGGAIVIPNNYFETRYLRRHQAHVRSYADSSCVELGRPYAELVQALNEIQAETQVPLIGFHEMDLDQIIQHTGLDRRQARLAARREYDEPFLIPGDPTPGTVRKVRQQATRQGFRVVKGGRFYHLTGKSNKGRAVRILIQLYRMAHQIQVFIGLGDSENDLSLLQNVTVPILMAKSDGTFDATILRRMPGVKRALAGPAGGSRSSAHFFANRQHDPFHQATQFSKVAIPAKNAAPFCESLGSGDAFSGGAFDLSRLHPGGRRRSPVPGVFNRRHRAG